MPFVPDDEAEVTAIAAPTTATAVRKSRFVPDAVQTPEPVAQVAPPAPVVPKVAPLPPPDIPAPSVAVSGGLLGDVRDSVSGFLGDQVDAFRDRYNRSEVATSQYIGDYIDSVRAADQARRDASGTLFDSDSTLVNNLGDSFGVAEAGAALGSQIISAGAGLVQGPTTEPGLNPAAEYRQFRERTSFTPRSRYGRAVVDEFGAALQPLGDAFEAAGRGVGNVAEFLGAGPEASEYLETVTPDVLGVGLRPAARAPNLRLPEALPQTRLPAPEPVARPVEARVVREGLEGPPGSVPPREAPPVPPEPPYTGPRARSDVEVARAAGYRLKPSEAGGGFVMRSTEGLSGSTRLETTLIERNQGVTNRLAAEDMGLENAPARYDRATFERAAAPQIAVYNQLGAQIGLRDVTPELRAELQQVVPERGATREVREAIADDVAGADFVVLDGREVVQRIRKLRADSSRLQRAQDPDQNTRGMAKRAIADALENEMARQAEAIGQPALVEQFRDARTRLAKINMYESALVGPDISAIKIAKMADRGAPITGRGAIIARVGRAFPNVMRPTAALKNRTNFGVVDSLAGAGGLGFGAAGNPLAGAAVAAARPTARAFLASNLYQNRLAPESPVPLGPNSPLGDYFQPPQQRTRTRRGAAPSRSTLRTDAPPPAPAPAGAPPAPIAPAAPASAAAPPAPAPAPLPPGAPLGDVLPPTRAPRRRDRVIEPADMSPRGNSGAEPVYTPPAEAAPAGRSLADELTDYGNVIDRELLVAATRRDGGVTYQPTTGHKPEPYKPGAYAVSPYPERGVILDGPDAVTKEAVDKFIDDNADLFAANDHYFGAWHDAKETGKVFLDVSIIEPTVEAAIARGKQTRQIAYFSFEDMKSHDIDYGSGADVRAEWVPPNERPQTDQGNATREAGNTDNSARAGGVETREPGENLRSSQGQGGDTRGGGVLPSSEGQQASLADELAPGARKRSRPEPVQTDSPEFKRWFGDSKAVDEDGKPLKLHHGTRSDFSAFDRDKQGAATGAASAAKGFFFSNRQVTADSYTNLVAPGEKAAHDALFDEATRLRKSWLRSHSQDPQKKAAAEAKAKRADELYREASEMRQQGGNVMSAYLSLRNPLVHDMKGKRYRDQSYSDIIDKALAAGHDGVIIKNTYDAVLGDGIADDVYIVFDPKQIKSATGNSGKFDPNVDDITGRNDKKDRGRKRTLADDLVGDSDSQVA